ncbi:MAG: pyridoxine 5'-phosphate synthase [Deltaproteobacteria bacterium]
MVRLSVNINKIATLRNSRGGAVPSVVAAARVCVEAGAPGITIHPRADQRHITRQDVLDLAAFLAPLRDRVEFNIEGDPREDLVALIHEVRPHQATFVPVLPDEITSQGGWPASASTAALPETISGLRAAGIRVGLFVDPDEASVRWAAEMGADRVELFTEPFARAAARSDAAAEKSFAACVRAARLAHSLGLGVNAGHDLDLENLVLFATLPHLDEVSIGHALISQSVFDGLDSVVRAYVALLEQTD